MIPEISVIMPVYNAEKYLAQAIESILNQVFTDFEFIIINDGSTDNSKFVILSYSDQRIKFIDLPQNKGIVNALNVGLRVARCKYIARMDADDISLPQRLELQYSYMENNNEIGLLSTNLNHIDEKGKIIKKCVYKDFDIPVEWLLLWYNPIAHPTAFFRKSIIDTYKLNYLEDTFPAEDYDLWCRIVAHSKIARINETLLAYRLSPQSISYNSKENAKEKSKMVVINYLKTNTKFTPSFFLNIFSTFSANNEHITNYKTIKSWFHKTINKFSKYYHWTPEEKHSVLRFTNAKINSYKTFILIPHINKNYIIQDKYNISLLLDFYRNKNRFYYVIPLYMQIKFIIKCLTRKGC